MKRIILSTTSSCLEELDVKHQIEFLRFNIHINNVDFVDGVNINADRLNKIMLDTPAAASFTTPEQPEEIVNKLKSLEQRGYTDVFIITISSAISQSYEHALTAKSLYTGKLNIMVYNSKAAAIMEGALAFEADQLLQQGKSFNEIVARLDDIRRNSRAYITVSRLDYLIANKKISTPAGFFANLFDIKPVIELNQAGELVPIKKVRSIEKSIDYIAETFQALKRDNNAFIYILSCGDVTLNDYTAKLLAERYHMPGLPMVPTSSITTANHGPNMVGIGAFLGQPPLITKYL